MSKKDFELAKSVILIIIVSLILEKSIYFNLCNLKRKKKENYNNKKLYSLA
jgi:hypothetical protein